MELAGIKMNNLDQPRCDCPTCLCHVIPCQICGFGLVKKDNKYICICCKRMDKNKKNLHENKTNEDTIKDQ
jgi:hypothetical protein